MIEQGSITKVRIDSIVPLPRRRQPTDAQIERVRKSLRENGLLSPIGIRSPSGTEIDSHRICSQQVLVYGATRLAAAKLEGWQEIDAQVFRGTAIDFLKAEIAENLHRGELSALEHDEQLAAYENLIHAEARAPDKTDDAIAAHPACIDLSAATRRKKVGHRAKGSTDPRSRRTAAKELGVDEKALRRAAKVATLPAEVKQAVCAVGLDNNQSALLAIAAEPTAETRIAKVYQLAERRREPHATGSSESTHLSASTEKSQADDHAADIIAAWQRASPDEKRRVWHKLRDEMLDIERTVDWFEIPAFLDRRRKPAIAEIQKSTASEDADQSGTAETSGAAPS